MDFGNMGWLEWLIAGVLVAFFLIILGGCSDQQKQDNVLQVLQEGKFAGSIHVASSGHPLSLHQTTSFGLGSELTVIADGKVNFAKPEAPD